MSDTYEIENDGANYSSHGAIAELVVKNSEIVSLKKEIITLKEREKKLTGIIKELCLFKTYDDYKFTFEQPVVFPLVEFESLNRRAREVLKGLGVE